VARAQGAGPFSSSSPSGTSSMGALYATMATPMAQARTVARPGVTPKSGGSIGITFPYGTPDCLDPQKTSLTASTVVVASVVDTLFSMDDKRQIRPDLATSYTYNASGSELTVSLAQGRALLQR